MNEIITEVANTSDMGPLEATVITIGKMIGPSTDPEKIYASIPRIYAIYAACLTVAPAEPAEEKQEPAVPIRKSVTPDFIISLEDGKKFKSLKRHLRVHYNLTPEQYREKWGLPADYPMVAPNYSATRSQLAKDHGLGKKD